MELRNLLKPRFIIPLTSFIIFFLFGFIFKYFCGCYTDYIHCWIRWDSAHYIEISKFGHTLYHCDAGIAVNTAADKWCGNAGWAPLYPFFIYLLKLSTFQLLSAAQAGVILSNIFFLGYLMIIAKIHQFETFSIRNWLIIFIAVFCPGNIYYHAIFPLSQTVFFIALLYYQLSKNRFVAAGIAGCLSVLSYSIGFFLLISLGFYAIYLVKNNPSVLKHFILKTIAISCGGLLILFAYDYLATGHWNAVFLVQEKYGYSLNSPLKILGIRIEKMLKNPDWSGWIIELQNILVLMIVLTITLRAWFRKHQLPIEVLGIISLFFFWFLPFSANSQAGLYRNAAMLGPGLSAQKQISNAALWLVFLAFLLLSFPMAQFYIQDIII
jgi:hypothetical protein